MVSNVVIYYLFKAGNYAICVTIHTFYTIDFCGGFVNPWALHCLFIFIGDLVLNAEGTAWILFEGSLNALLGLSLFTLVFICIFPAWPMWACGFSLCWPGFLEDGFERRIWQFLVNGLVTYVKAILLEILHF